MDLEIWGWKKKRKTDIVIANKELIMKKEIENKEILRNNTKISSPPYKSELWKAINVNNKLKLTVDEQQGDIKHLKHLCDIHNEIEVQEITAAMNPMKKKNACMCDM